jgi:Sec-independent protein translocase protein TatA
MRLSFVQGLIILILLILLFGDLQKIKEFLNKLLIKVRIFFNKNFDK